VTPEALEAESIARSFGLTYLSAEGYAKLAEVLAYVRAMERVEKPRPRLEPHIIKTEMAG